MSNDTTLAEVPETGTETPETVETPETETSEPQQDDKPEGETVEAEKPEQKEQKPEPTEAEKIKYAMQKRIDRQTAKNAQMERELAELRAKVQSIEPKQETGEPKEDQFETIEQYLIAKGEYNARKKYEAEQAKAKQEQADREYAEKVAKIREGFVAKETEFRKTTPDYDGVVTVVNDFLADADPNAPQIAVFRDFIMESDNPASILYKLGKQPELLEELSEMTPIKLAKALVRIEMEASNAPSQAKPNQPKPLSPVKGSAFGSKSIEQMSYQEMKKAMRL